MQSGNGIHRVDMTIPFVAVDLAVVDVACSSCRDSYEHSNKTLYATISLRLDI